MKMAMQMVQEPADSAAASAPITRSGDDPWQVRPEASPITHTRRARTEPPAKPRGYKKTVTSKKTAGAAPAPILYLVDGTVYRLILRSKVVIDWCTWNAARMRFDGKMNSKGYDLDDVRHVAELVVSHTGRHLQGPLTHIDQCRLARRVQEGP